MDYGALKSHLHTAFVHANPQPAFSRQPHARHAAPALCPQGLGKHQPHFTLWQFPLLLFSRLLSSLRSVPEFLFFQFLPSPGSALAALPSRELQPLYKSRLQLPNAILCSQQGITTAYNDCGRCRQVFHLIFDALNSAERGTLASAGMHEPALCYR